jgi:hypothetical protein
VGDEETIIVELVLDWLGMVGFIGCVLKIQWFCVGTDCYLVVSWRTPKKPQLKPQTTRFNEENLQISSASQKYSGWQPSHGVG